MIYRTQNRKGLQVSDFIQTALGHRFRKLGFIAYNRKIEVHNSLLNVILYDKPELKRMMVTIS
jgi:hypothetical protein